MATISACIISKNESENIERCINSVKTICDEIIVLDTGSNDDTVAIAQNLSAKTYYYQWNDDFSAARNECLQYATCDFILIIDADEELVKEDFSLQQLKNSDFDIGGFILDAISYSHINGYQAKYISPQLRIFRNRRGFSFSGRIHEQITPSIIEKGYKIDKVHWRIIHHGYNLSKEQLRHKNLRNIKILEKESLHNNDPLLCFHKARTYYALNMLKQSINEINFTLKNITTDHFAYSSILAYAAKLYFKSEDFLRAKELAMRAHMLDNALSEPLYILSEIYIRERDYTNALQCYKSLRASTDKKKVYFSWGDTILPFQLFESKYIYSLYKSGEKDKSIELLNQHLNNNPNNVEAYLVKLSILIHEQDLSGFRNLLTQLINIYPRNNKLQHLKQKYLPYEQQILISKPRISLSMIVKNEEKMLADCLNSVSGIVDEIVIVDTGSTDKTQEISESFGAKVYHFNWNNNFSDARNYSLSKCSGDWILYLDADERLVLPHKDYLIELLSNAQDSIGAFLCTIESPHRKDDSSVEMHRALYPRLFRNYHYPNIRFTGKIHEQITPALQKMGKQIIQSKIIIEHLGYDVDLHLIQEKIKRNYNLLMIQIKEEPTNGYLWFQLGQTLGRLKLVEQSINALEFALQVGNLSESIKASAYSTLSQLKGNQRDFAKSLYYAEKSLEIVPEQRYARNLKGYSLLYLGRFDDAEKEFNLLLQNIKNRDMVPFDIEVPKNIIEQGLMMAINRKII